MRIALVVAGEVKVDIRLFISLKSEKCLKGDIKSVLLKHFAAHRTFLIRHVHPAAAGIFPHFS